MKKCILLLYLPDYKRDQKPIETSNLIPVLWSRSNVKGSPPLLRLAFPTTEKWSQPTKTHHPDSLPRKKQKQKQNKNKKTRN